MSQPKYLRLFILSTITVGHPQRYYVSILQSIIPHTLPLRYRSITTLILMVRGNKSQLATEARWLAQAQK